MRSSLDILEEIRATLSAKKLIAEKEELDAEIRASSTAEELCLRSAETLLSLQKRHPEVKNAIGHLIEEFTSYCTYIGIHPKG
ncbi:MAG: hypothetical protein IPJ32_09845 [Sphingobacteriaceae bacterium]|nr:hypothetical protein [Sphingobacteriaceae bacterium]